MKMRLMERHYSSGPSSKHILSALALTLATDTGKSSTSMTGIL